MPRGAPMVRKFSPERVFSSSLGGDVCTENVREREPDMPTGAKQTQGRPEPWLSYDFSHYGLHNSRQRPNPIQYTQTSGKQVLLLLLSVSWRLHMPQSTNKFCREAKCRNLCLRFSTLTRRMTMWGA